MAGLLICAITLLLADSTMLHFRVFAIEMDVEKSFEYNEVVPGVVSKAPEEMVNVTYPSGVEVNLGNKLTPTSVKDQPNLFWNAEDDEFYTVVMIDPDAPSRKDPIFREWKHWLVGNIPGTKIAAGDQLAAYVGAAPGQDSGLHRYVFLVYKQNCRIRFREAILPNTSAANRTKFSTAAFAKKYCLGKPIAGNFFQAAYDDYVPQLKKQLGL